MDTSPKFPQTILLLADLLKNHQYAFRGTASLVLQGFDFKVDDIDILTDRPTAEACNETLKEYLKEGIAYKESEKFKSWYGKFDINGLLVEVYGDWQIKNSKGEWSRVFDASDDEVKEIDYQGKKIRVTTPETELATYAAIGRWNVFHKLKKELAAKAQPSLF
jgi:hypothetical protein